MSICPPVGRLNDLLEDRLPAQQRDEIEDHLAECPHCQKALLDASGDADEWCQLETLLQPSTDTAQTPPDLLARLRKTSLSAASTRETDRPPLTISCYEILGELGRGGTAVVYRARHVGLNRQVALKVVHAGRDAPPEVRSRLRREAEAVARLQHPGIVQVYDVGEHDGLPYLAMELVEGGTLRDHLRAERPTAHDAAVLVEAIARAIHVAHTAGVFHRDIKPANILLSGLARSAQPLAPKVADFGMALDREAGEGWTRAGDVIGTPAYMAPEQAQGRRADIGPATDVHALGVVLYEALTGRTPFAAGDDLSTLLQVSFEEPVPLRRLQPTSPRDLETICLKCLEKSPSKRYASALDLAEDLRRFQTGEPIHARPAGARERLVKLARRHPLVAALLAGIVVVTATAFAGISAALLEARSARDDEARQRGRAEDALDRSERSVYLGTIAQARSQWFLNNVPAAARLLDLCSSERRNWEWHYLRSLNHGDLLTVPDTSVPWVTGVAFSPDGRWVASSGGDPYASPNTGVVQVLDAVTGRVLWRKDGLPHLVRNLAFSPDGRLLATAGGNWREDGGGKLRVWDAATGGVVRDFVGHDAEPVYRVAFTPDGRKLASTSHRRATRVWDIASGAEVYRTGATETDSVAFTPDGRFLVYDGPDGIAFCETSTGANVRVTPHVPGLFAISPEGTRLATAHRDQLRVWDVSITADGVSLSLAQAFGGHEGWIMDLVFRPDGQGVATAGSDGTVRVWDLSADAEPIVFRGHTGRVGAVAFHPDGRAVASGGKPPGDVRVWDATRKPEYVTVVSFSRERRDVAAIGFTADDRELLALAEGGLLRRWNCVTGRTAEREVPYSGKWVVPGATSALSGDGSIVATVAGQVGDANALRVIDTVTGRELAVLRGHTGKVRFVACDATGDRVVTGGTGVRDGKPVREVRVWDARLGTVAREESAEGEHCDGVVLSPDGTQLVDARRGAGASIVLTDLTGAVPPRRMPVPGSVAALAFSPRGRFIAVVDGDGAVWVWGRDGKTVHERPLPGPAGLGGLAFSPDETRLAGVTRDRVQVWDVASGQDVLFLRGAGPWPHDNGFNPRVAWSHDGTKLAASNWDRTVSVWDSADTTTNAGKATLAAWAAGREFEWHRQRTERYGRPEVAFAAAFHRDRALAQNVDSPFSVRQRGDLLARLGRFEEARAMYARLFANSLPESTETCREYAALLVATGNYPAYSDLRRAALARWAGASEPEILYPLVILGGLLPAPPVEAALLLSAAERYRAVGPTDRTPRAALAAALDRAGNWSRGREELEQALANTPEGEWVITARARHALLAVRLGRDAEAEAGLKRIDEWLAGRAARLPPATLVTPPEWEWTSDLEVRALRGEAQILRARQSK